MISEVFWAVSLNTNLFSKFLQFVIDVSEVQKFKTIHSKLLKYVILLHLIITIIIIGCVFTTTIVSFNIPGRVCLLTLLSDLKMIGVFTS